MRKTPGFTAFLCVAIGFGLQGFVLNNVPDRSMDNVCRTCYEATADTCPNPPCPEICDNGIDDDGDGLIDCYDTYDCPCTDLGDCKTTTFHDKDFGARLAWENTSNIVNAASVPMVANLNPWIDSIPEIIVHRYTGGNNSNQLLIFQGDGSNAGAPATLTVAGGLNNYPGPAPLIADINNDGIPELIIVCKDKKIRVYTNYNPAANPVMKLMTTSNGTTAQVDDHVYAADFNSDGQPELYAGTKVFGFDFSNPANPQLNLLASGPAGPVGELSSFFGNNGASSVAADFLSPADCNGDPDCGGLEIAAGNAIYSVDISTTDGDPMQVKLQKNLNTLVPGHNFTDGYTTFADIDLNGIPDVIVSGSANNKRGVYAWNKTGFYAFFPNQNDNQYSTGIVAVANVFDDKTKGYVVDYPELIVTNSYSLNCFNYHAAQANPAQPYWWVLPTTDYSGYTGVTTFDFNGDKIMELVYRDEKSLRIMYGGPTPFPAGVDAERNWDTFPVYSITADEYPVVADVDNDGQAEIVMTGAIVGIPSQPYSGRLLVLESDQPKHDPWLSARPVWNQYNYFVTNINDDLTVPKVQQSSWVEMPFAGSGKHPMNNFLFQVPRYDKNYNPYLPLPDASVKVVDASCAGNLHTVTLKMCSEGSVGLKKNIPISFYTNGDPFTTVATRIATFSFNPAVLAVGNCLDQIFTIPNNITGKVYAVLNDSGLVAPPFLNDTVFRLTECNYGNNRDSFFFPKPAQAVHLGPDTTVCLNTVLTLQPGNGYASYLWQDGSTDSSYIAGQPGKYWVAVSDGCHNTWRDTMEIIQDPVAPFDLGIDQHFCKHATVHFNVNGFQDYQWQGVGLNCNDCPDPVAQADVTGMYKLTARSAIGCYTSDSIRVFVHDTTLQQIYTVRCLGDQFTYNGVSIPAGSSQTFSYYSAWGCDSTIQVQVAMLPRSKDSTIYRLCPGQSVQVFGQTVDTPGVFVHHFKNWQGCDSLHTVRVKFYPPVSPSTELRTICPGDSTFVFGVPIKMAGTFQWHYTDQHGCDSIHIIKVVQFPAPQATFETRHICPGDSTMAYGNPIKAAGSYAFHFGSATGCDSVHIVQVVLYQAPQPTTELRHICAGDSTMVYSTAIHAAGSYSYHFSGYTGCDSVHTVQVMLYPAPQPTSELRQICPGDSTTVFGVFVKTNGTFAHHLSGYQGCDSVHAVQVKIYPVSPSTAETIHICPGDSVQVFGTAVGSAGKYTHHFAGYYGCDSLHVITVILYPGPQPTTESRHICPGDSTLVYGSYIKTAGNYLHHYANGTGCDSVHVISVSVFALPQPTGEVRSICPGDSTQVFGAFVQSAGDYVHHFLNGNGCDSVHTVHVTVYPAPVPDVASRTICPGDSILIFNQFIHAAGIYSQVFSNINGCDSVRTVTVTLFPEPQHTSVEKSICAGDSVLIFGQWRQQPGIFSRHFQNVNGCDSVHTITLAVHPLPQPVFAVQPPGCKETTGILNIQNPAGLVFSIDGVHVGQTTQFAGLLPGSYLLTTRDPNTGCTAFRDFTVTVPPPNQFVSDSLTICAGDSVQVFGEWKHVPGVFTHIFANQYNCDSVVTRTLLVLQQALYGIHVKQPTCLDTTGLLTINAITQGATFSLDNADFTASTIFDDLTPGQHWISARSPEGCVQSGTFLIRAVEHPWLQLPGDTMVELGQPVLILPQIYPPANYVYTWLPPDYLNCTDCPKPVSVPLHNVEYSLVITDSKGCTATDRIAIHVSEPDIYVPNVFSPNEDNQNEYFTIYSSSNGLKRILKLQIFDRWGNLLFERNDFPPNIDHLGWHGDFNGRAMDPGVFVWWAEVEYLNGRKVLLKGDVTLVK